MRKPFHLLRTMLAVLMLLVPALPVEGQTQKPDRGVVVGKGSVGESGASAQLVHQVKAKTQRLLVLRNVQSSLCGNTGAVALLVVNGVPKVHGIITKTKSSLHVKAKPGDRVVAIVHTIPLFNGIVCIRLGELSFELRERLFAK